MGASARGQEPGEGQRRRDKGNAGMDVNTKANGNYAILFRTHFWDDYVERQYQRLLSVAGGGDVFILVDETSRPVPVPHPNVVPHTQQGVLDLGLAGAGHGNMLWFNGDYPLYYFYQQHSGYDYYVMTEYDVVVQRSLDDVVAQVERGGVDLVGLSNTEAPAVWPLAPTCRGVYSDDELRKCLICFSVFSNRAVRRLLDRRLEMSRQHEAGLMQRWPHCEAFIPTEVAAAGFKMAELSEFGPTSRYDWKPAIIETELPALAGQAFVHPLLNPQRYVPHIMVDLWPPEAFFDPRNAAGRRLRRAPISAYGPPLAQALWRRAGAPFRKLLLAGRQART